MNIRTGILNGGYYHYFDLLPDERITVVQKGAVQGYRDNPVYLQILAPFLEYLSESNLRAEFFRDALHPIWYRRNLLIIWILSVTGNTVLFCFLKKSIIFTTEYHDQLECIFIKLLPYV